MELKTENDQTQQRDRAIVYQAIGWMVGRYQPSADKPDCGMLLTEDGQIIPAQVSWHLHKQMHKKFGELGKTANWHGEKFLWTVYPSTKPLRVQLVNINLLQPPVENATTPEAEQAKSNKANKNLLKLLKDLGASFTPGSLDYVLSGDTENIHHTLLQTADGKFYLILWQEVSGYNVDNKKWLNVPSQKVTLTLNTDIAKATIYLPNDSASLKSSQTYPKQLDIDIPDHRVVIELAGN